MYLLNLKKDLIHKVEDLAKLNGLSNDNSNEAQTDKLNIDYYRSEIRKRDEYIRLNLNYYLFGYEMVRFLIYLI